MAEHPLEVWLRYGDGFTFVDITDDVAQTVPVRVIAGAAMVSEAPAAERATFTLEDPDGVYRPQSPTSPLYGKAARLMPCLIGRTVLTEDFESSPLSITVSQGASVNGWARSTTSPHSGSWCFKSGATANGQFSDAIVTLPDNADIVMFWYRTDCGSASDLDQLQVWSERGVVLQANGTAGIWRFALIRCTPEMQGNVRFRYVKDSAGAFGADAVYIDDLVFFSSRLYGEVASWDPQSEPGRQGQTDVEVVGQYDRVGSWTDKLRSAMTRKVLQSFADLTGLWPMEDGARATGLANLADGGPAGTVLNADPGMDDVPAGLESSWGIRADTVMSGSFLRAAPGAWSVLFSFRLTAARTSTRQELFRVTSSAGHTYVISCNDATFRFEIFSAAGSSLVANNILYGTGITPSSWTMLRLRVEQNGGNIDYNFTWFTSGSPGVRSFPDSISGTAGYAVGWQLTGNAYWADGFLGLIYGLPSVAEGTLGGNYARAFDGWVGELTAERYGRLLNEEGLFWTRWGVEPDYPASPWTGVAAPMGAQRPDTLINLLKEIADTDGGLLYDRNRALYFRMLGTMIGQEPSLELTYGVNVGPPLKPNLSNIAAANVIAVSQRDGSEVVVSDTTTLMGAQGAPNGIGPYKQQVDVNVRDEALQLEQIGYWALNVGTTDAVRYPAVTVDLDANPELEGAVDVIKPGDRITVAGLDPDVIDLMVIGWDDSQRDSTRRTRTFKCVPYEPYRVGTYDDDASRWGIRDAVLSAGYNATTTSMQINFPDRFEAFKIFTVGSVADHFDVLVGGERITVRSTGAVVSAGGGRWSQALTVARSVNGVVKAHAAGAEVRIVDTGRWGLWQVEADT